jgi:hypothetical protein
MVMVFVGAIFAVSGMVPLGPSSFIEGESSRQVESAYPAGTHEAFAGNITRLTIHGTTQTKHWQGYYGDVTGTIVLDDAQNWTFYDWPNLEPKGEIYATATAATPSWTTVECFDYMYVGSGDLEYWEGFYNMTYNDVDGIDETFNMTSHPIFDVGNVVTIFADTCPSTYTHINNEWQDVRFVQVLLTDENGQLIFTTILENKDEANNTDIMGFRPDITPDFQLLVAEDGTSRTGPGGTINQITTTYYFYVDLE